MFVEVLFVEQAIVDLVEDSNAPGRFGQIELCDAIGNLCKRARLGLGARWCGRAGG
jgi:hypothetical protein